MSIFSPKTLTKEQHDEVERIEHMPRKDRRKLGKQLRVKIPGKNAPNVNTINVLSHYGESRK